MADSPAAVVGDCGPQARAFMFGTLPPVSWVPEDNADHIVQYTLSPKLDEIGIVTGTCDEINAITPGRANVEDGSTTWRT